MQWSGWQCLASHGLAEAARINLNAETILIHHPTTNHCKNLTKEA